MVDGMHDRVLPAEYCLSQHWYSANDALLLSHGGVSVRATSESSSSVELFGSDEGDIPMKYSGIFLLKERGDVYGRMSGPVARTHHETQPISQGLQNSLHFS